ncbi:Fur-regulated basic protein FbpA [Bacillus thuringiensis serovar darmstadiensis]|nr:Fur-regulated basic protein FbpA [Bacillus thuringiensis]OTZ90702.1 Fur-regulated basic protein FbpA [Bacillus thuringiensis serovar darmstadiensis]
MSSQLRFAVENRKRHLIDELIGAGVFKIRDRQLYELSLEELEKEYEDIEDYAANIQA